MAPKASRTLGRLELAVPGRHNLQNALAAVAVGERVGLDFDRVAAALTSSMAPNDGSSATAKSNGILVVDDYGHHPTEIAAVMAAARATLNRRLVVAFQPHRHSRTAHLMDAFGPALREADEIVLTDIYGAGEEPIAGVTVDRLAESIRTGSGRPVHVARTLDDVVDELMRIVRPGDAVVTLGAGSIGTLAKRADQGAGGKGAASLIPVAAPADKRFRRSRVSLAASAVVAAIVVDGRSGRRRRPCHRVRVLSRVRLRDGFRGADRHADFSAGHRAHVARRSAGLLDGLSAPASLMTDLERWRQEAAHVALGG